MSIKKKTNKKPKKVFYGEYYDLSLLLRIVKILLSIEIFTVLYTLQTVNRNSPNPITNIIGSDSIQTVNIGG